MNEKLPFCECGKCGLRVTKKGNRFIHGHNKGFLGKSHSPEATARMSANKLGKPRTSPAQIAVDDAKRSPHHTRAQLTADDAKKGVPHSQERIVAISKGLQESDANKAQIETMRGGNDICNHHYIYDHDDLSKHTMKMTRSDHQKLHNLLRKLGYKVPHINR